MERILKKFAFDKISKFVPPNQLKFVNKINKSTKKRHKKSEKKEQAETKKNDNKKMYDEDDDDDDDDQMDGNEMKVPKKLEKKFIMETGDDPTDFLSNNAINKISSFIPNKKKDEEKRRKRENSFPVKEGKFFIEDPEAQKDQYDDEDEAEMTFKELGIALEKERSKKRKTGREEEIQPKKTKRPNKVQKSGTDIYSGKRYKAKNASGDIKKGKFDPFAYIRFDPTALNKRNRSKSSQQFSDVIGKAAKRGAQRGRKLRKKFQKKENEN